jgi:hypothetical protein
VAGVKAKVEIPLLDGWLGTTETGRRLQISRSAVHKNLNTGRFRTARRTAGEYSVFLIRTAEVEHLMELNPDGGMARIDDPRDPEEQS